MRAACGCQTGTKETGWHEVRSEACSAADAYRKKRLTPPKGGAFIIRMPHDYPQVIVNGKLLTVRQREAGRGWR
jgi:hypothetical protein